MGKKRRDIMEDKCEPIKPEKKAILAVAAYLESEGISPMEELQKVIEELPKEMQAILWMKIIEKVDPSAQTPIVNNNLITGDISQGAVPKVIRQTHSEDELIRIAEGGKPSS